MISKSSTFCPAPWTMLNIDQAGCVTPCFHFQEEIGNIAQTTIQEVISGPVQQLRETIARGEWHPGCTWCRELEQTTGRSARTVMNVDKDTVDAIDQDITHFNLQHLVINWSNLCNLSCTYCNPRNSTSWQALRKQPIQLIKNQHADIMQLAQEQGHNIRGLSLGGGEPLLQKGLPEFLGYLNPEKTNVLVTTNLSVPLNQNMVYATLKQWPHVTWQISFDNCDPDRFEYVRRGASWQQFENNIDRLLQDSQTVWAHPAYSIYNALDLMSYYEFCDSKGIGIFWCELLHPFELDVRRYSAIIRREAQEEIDRVIEKWGNRRNMNIEKLQGYRKQLADPSYLISLTLSPLVEWHQQQESLIAHNRTFQQLWPRFSGLDIYD